MQVAEIIMVPVAGLEPASLAAADFESSPNGAITIAYAKSFAGHDVNEGGRCKTAISSAASDCKSTAPLCFPTIFPRNNGGTFPEQVGNAVTRGCV